MFLKIIKNNDSSRHTRHYNQTKGFVMMKNASDATVGDNIKCLYYILTKSERVDDSFTIKQQLLHESGTCL